MIELLAGTAAILGVLLVTAIAYAVTYRRERDDFRDLHEANSKFQAGTIEILGNRVTNMRADIQTLETALDTMRTGHDRLVDERDLLKRQIGRMEAEARSLKPKRGPNGKFVAKPKAPKPAKPVACG